ncbi:hypothetical protein JY97_08740 [Alkalispirochaeta odontotermitis]|nr:hypothetical protein JY97_08740 [Alkalispirochaeta odontotermitis]CAB1083076.1 hypothetical protein D1AOALGA4SA_10660 [Olavius algarvensis Delta 1 endosymbiont]
MLEYWNVGMLKIRRRRTGFSDLGTIFYNDGPDRFIKSDRHPLSIPNFPSFHYSTIPFGI